MAWKRSVSRISTSLVAVALGTVPTLVWADTLYLDVSVNKQPTGLVVAFEQELDGDLSLSSDDLDALRIARPATVPDRMRLRQVAGLRYQYDPANQSLELRVPTERLATTRVDVSGSRSDVPDAERISPSAGFLLNYTLFAASFADRTGVHGAGWSAALDARRFWAGGEIQQTGLVGSFGADRSVTALRLESTWRRLQDGERPAISIGDGISSAAAWSRPVRFAGIQIGRDFSNRPDLVTAPLPSVSGVAAVPSTLDLYVDGVRRFSQDVPQGRFQIDNIPGAGAGNARVIVRDLQGRELITNRSFFVSDRLLSAGLSQFSVEAGFVRRSFGVQSWDYDRQPFASGSARYGLPRGLTLDGHAEAGLHVALLGGGIAAPIGGFGVAHGSFAASVSSAGTGTQARVGLDIGLRVIRFSLESTRASPAYRDVAAVSAAAEIARLVPVSSTLTTALLPPRAVDRASLSMTLPFGGALGFTAARERRQDGEGVRSVSVNYQRAIWRAASISIDLLRTSVDRERPRNGVFARLNIPLGGRVNVAATLSHDDRGWAPGVEMSRAGGIAPGDLAWRAGVAGGNNPAATAAIEYRTRVAIVRADVSHRDGTTYGDISVEGSLVHAGGWFAVAPVGHTFAIVNTGAPDVAVMSQNRPVGRTNNAGLLLVGDIRPYERTTLTVDADALPADLELAVPERIIRPTGIGAVHVSFATTHVTGALLHLIDSKGADLPVGSAVRLDSGEETQVGYGGLVMITNVAQRNVIEVTLATGRCIVGVSGADLPSTLVASRPLACLAPLQYVRNDDHALAAR